MLRCLRKLDNGNRSARYGTERNRERSERVTSREKHALALALGLRYPLAPLAVPLLAVLLRSH